MRWNELNLEEGYWAIPKEKMKMNIEFVCPSPQKSDRGVSGAILSDTLVRLGYQNRHTVHGFRSMFSTIVHNLYKEHGFHRSLFSS